MATRQKKTAARKRSASRSKKKSPGTLRRFLVSFTSTTIVVFGIASCVLNPRLTEALRDSPYLSHIDWPGVSESPPPHADAHADAGNTVTRFNRCPQFFPGGQAPRLPAGEHLRELCFDAFAVLYSGKTKTPVFTAERLNRAGLAAARGEQRTNKFYEEARLPMAERATLADYQGSGYDRGHQAPAGDMPSPKAMAQSFSLANMVPQSAENNRGVWARRVEAATRHYVERAQGDVHVFTGPVFEGGVKTIGKGRIWVPTYLFKLVYDPGAKRAWAYWVKNTDDAKVTSPISYRELVNRIGIELLPGIPLKN